MSTVDAVKAGEDEDFFSRYDWCLNPLQTVRDLLCRARAEPVMADSAQISWQREESRINLYLFHCALSCAADDYLAHRWWEIQPLVPRLPRMRLAIEAAEFCLNMFSSLAGVWARRRVRQWRRDVNWCVDRICRLLVSGAGSEAPDWDALRFKLESLQAAPLPAPLLDWRMRIPEAFRCQDLSHHDVLALTDLLPPMSPESTPVAIVGPRTAGSYFAPLAAAHLLRRGIPVSGWMTFRPKCTPSTEEKRQFRRLIARSRSLVIIDDYPNTGNTLRLFLKLLRRLGAGQKKTFVLAPQHPAQWNWARMVQGATVITLPTDELYKQKLLSDEAEITSNLQGFYSKRGWEQTTLLANADIEAVNSRLHSHAGDGLHVRLKRVYEVRLSCGSRPAVVKRVIAKSVGWGWLGYHAYITGSRLAEFVPPVLGLRDGLLFREWVGELSSDAARPNAAAVTRVLPSYLAARVKRLRLPEDPWVPDIRYCEAGWAALVEMFRRPYGSFLGRAKSHAMLSALKSYVSPLPTLIDGGMGPEEWIETDTGVLKIDFAHHNYGGSEPGLADPVYDLASAIHAFGLSETEERTLVESYLTQSGDKGIDERLLLYKLLSGVFAINRAVYSLRREVTGEQARDWNRRYIEARNFQTYVMSRHAARCLHGSPPVAWSERLFFLDLDGVFDCECLGFPHTTRNGLLALYLLKLHNYSAVLNTGRSVEHVRHYCRTYRLPGGVAEYGSAFVDAVREREIPLADPAALHQLQRCRALLRNMPDVYVDPTYEYAVRAYRWKDGRPAGLPASETAALLKEACLDRLAVITMDVDCYFVQNGTRQRFGG